MLRHHGPKVILATAVAAGVLGAGVAVADDQPTCPYGNTPQAGQQAQNGARQGDRAGDRERARKRDGTGARHSQRAGQRRGQRQHAQGQHRGEGERGEQCPYR